MTNELEALLALQTDDDAVDAIADRIAALGPREEDLERRREVAADALARAQGAVDSDRRKHGELGQRLAEHKQRQERNLATLEAVKRMREATAAMAQVEQARKILIEEETELATISRRIADGEMAVETQREALAAVESVQTSDRAAIAAERAELEAALADARAKRDSAAAGVPRALLGKYERVRGRRRSTAVFPLRGGSCANCDTAIPLHRRSQMQSSGSIEPCEGCGVLLYAAT